MYDTEHINEYDDWISKSQLKRESKELHALGEVITKLTQSEFDRIDFADNDSFRQELVFARKLLNNPQFEPYRREMLHVERIMRSMEDEYITFLSSQVNTIKSKKVIGNANFHRLEKIRDDLLGENCKEALDQLIATNVRMDRNKLRTLIKKAKTDPDPNRQLAAKRELFRYVRDNLDLGEKNV